VTPLRVLILEDSEEDAALLVLALQDGGYSPVWERVATAGELAAALDRQSWDVILAAYVMARLTVRQALAVVRGRGLDVPFIAVSRKKGEEMAVEAMRQGAHDYVLMQSLARLVPAVEREVREAAGRTGRQRTEDALRRLVKAVETVDIGITVTDLDGRIIYTNPAEARMHGYTIDDLVGRNANLLAPRPLRRELTPHRLRELKGWRREAVNVRKDGTTFPVQLVSDAVTDASGLPIGIVTCCVDISERKKAEDALRASEARYRTLFERNLAGVYRATMQGVVLDCNDALVRMLGWSHHHDLRSRTVADFYYRAADLKRVMTDLRRQGSLASFEVRLRRRDGSAVWVLASASLLLDQGGTQIVEGTVIDVTDRKQAIQKLEFQAHHDPLTGLPNRVLLEENLALALRRAEQNGGGAALLYLDLDRLKAINDTLGHDAGDALLHCLGERLTHCLRREDTVARVGGDEFVVLLPAVRSEEEAGKVAQKILEHVARRFHVAGHEVHVTCSVGIALYPHDGGDAELLQKRADDALYRAKQLGRNAYRFASRESQEQTARRSELERDLRRALERRELLLHYQPQVALADGSLCGVEALLRWRRRQGGMVMPGDFVPLAEDLGIIVPIGEWVMLEACRQARTWQVESMPALGMAINLSVRQFAHPNLHKVIEGALTDSGLAPPSLLLEITESVAMQNLDWTTAMLGRIADLGVRLFIDDFGTGHSSLSYLKQLPINGIKIDRGFVAGLGRDARDGTIVEAIVSMAHSLGLQVVAEGVEAAEQLALLRDLGCDVAQGHAISRSLPPAGIAQALRWPAQAFCRIPPTAAGPAEEPPAPRRVPKLVR
jgi:diguanylate cyclase (GGDEF)-like protein/PAS domain S-box-containing protein